MYEKYIYVCRGGWCFRRWTSVDHVATGLIAMVCVKGYGGPTLDRPWTRMDRTLDQV